MKFIDLSPLRPKPGQKQIDWQTRLQVILKQGWRWYQLQQAEDKVIAALGRTLDNRFTLVRGFRLPGREAFLPPVLIGPPGVFLLYVWPKPGFFRIREGQWEIMQRSSRRYRPGKENIVQEVKELSGTLAAFLAKRAGQQVKVTPLIVFSDVGADVDAVRPAVRPLLLDGLKRYAAKLGEAEVVLKPTDLLTVTDAFRSKPLAEQKAKRKAARRKASRRPPKSAQKIERYFNFTPKQWAVLGVLAALVILTFVCIILYALTMTP